MSFLVLKGLIQSAEGFERWRLRPLSSLPEQTPFVPLWWPQQGVVRGPETPEEARLELGSTCLTALSRTTAAKADESCTQRNRATICQPVFSVGPETSQPCIQTAGDIIFRDHLSQQEPQKSQLKCRRMINGCQSKRSQMVVGFLSGCRKSAMITNS